MVVLSVSAKTNQSADVIAKTLYHEARGEGTNGLRAVASVIHNRSTSRVGKAGAGILSLECLRKKQFSCWNGKKNLKSGSGKAWDECVKIANEMVAGKFKPTHSYTHYYAYKICNPKWAKGKQGIVIGNHKFLNA
jgi:spore germination cell wall hydrolase CwlJ-like protein